MLVVALQRSSIPSRGNSNTLSCFKLQKLYFEPQPFELFVAHMKLNLPTYLPTYLPTLMTVFTSCLPLHYLTSPYLTLPYLTFNLPIYLPSSLSTLRTEFNLLSCIKKANKQLLITVILTVLLVRLCHKIWMKSRLMVRSAGELFTQHFKLFCQPIEGHFVHLYYICEMLVAAQKTFCKCVLG